SLRLGRAHQNTFRVLGESISKLFQKRARTPNMIDMALRGGFVPREMPLAFCQGCEVMTIVAHAGNLKGASLPSTAPKFAPVTRDYATRHSRYAYGCDVRATYALLPCQPFWTWLTGKALPKGPPRAPAETLLTEVQLWCQIA